MTAERSIELLSARERGGWLLREKYLLSLIPPHTRVALNVTGLVVSHAEAMAENDAALARNAQELKAIALDV